MDCRENSNDDNTIKLSIHKKDMDTEEFNVKENEDPNVDQPLDLSMKKVDIKPVKRGRKTSDTTVPRRNPKRQTRSNKLYKLIDDIAAVDEIAEKAKKAKVVKEQRAIKKQKSVRYSARVHNNVGAVYSPPSPLSRKHMRNWPTEGMHEKPEFDPKTGKIEPLDFFTRGITDSYNKRKAGNAAEAATKTNSPKNGGSSQNFDDEDRIDIVSHVVLHRVISYAASALQLKKKEKESSKKKYKTQFLSYLGLEENKVVEAEKDKLNEIIDGALVGTDDIKYNIKELLKNAMIKYCISNHVHQSDLAKYIDSLSPEDVPNMLIQENLSQDEVLNE